MSKSVFILVLTVNSYSESIVDQPRAPAPPVPIAIFSSQSPLLSVTPFRCMDTANFINVKVWVCYSFLKHNVFSAKAKESFVVTWIIEEIHLENRQRVSHLDFQKLSHFRFIHKDNAKWHGGSAEVSHYYYLQDSHEIVLKFPCMEVAKFTDRDWTFWDVLPAAPRRRFQMLRLAKG